MPCQGKHESSVPVFDRRCHTLCRPNQKKLVGATILDIHAGVNGRVRVGVYF